MSDTCAYKRCRQPSTVGVRPTRGTDRFLCHRHWAELADLPGSVCDSVLEYLRNES